MQQKKIKLSERTKNLIIIVLAVLVLAALIIKAVLANSGTEVSAEYITAGTLSTTLRGTGTVESNASVDVLCEKGGIIHSVHVQEGDEVRAGDVLVEFSDYAEAELEKLRSELDALVLEYQLALVDQSGEQYSKEQNAIAQAEAALEKAKADCEENLVTDAELQAARDKVTSCEKAIAAKEDEIARLQAAGVSDAVTLEDAQAKLQTAMLVHRGNYDTVVSLANTWMTQDGLTVEQKAHSREAYISAVIEDLTADIAKFKKQLEDTRDYEEMDSLQRQIESFQSLIDSYKIVNDALEVLEKAQSATSLSDAKDALVSLKRQKTNADTELTELKAKRSAWQSANTALEANRQAVDTAIEALEAAQNNAQKEDLKLSAQKEDIDEKRAEIAALTGEDGGEATYVPLLSKYNGLVTSVIATAGSSADAGGVLMSIEVPDMGYTVSIPVSREQSSMVSEGDIGSVTIGYEPAEISAVLKEIKPNPEDPAQKLLVFELQGEADTGAVLSISVGEPDEAYDMLIPPAALRKDSSGSFVLALDVKRGLFGTRYAVSRVPVEVLARDDESIAISGELPSGTMVITTNPCDLHSGDTVRITD